TSAGSETFAGFYGREPNRERTFGKVEYVNVDNQIGYLLFGTGGVRYVNKHEYPKWKGVEDILVLNDLGRFRLSAGERRPPLAIVSLPNATAAATAEARRKSSLLEADDPDAILLTTADGTLVWA